MAGKIIMSWSGGKDSSMTLHELRKNNNYEIVALLTTVTEDYNRISMHGVRCYRRLKTVHFLNGINIRNALLEKQANCLGLHLEKVWISKESSNIEYESKMREVLEKYMKAGVTSAAFGDIFLEDLRKYREDNMAKIGMKAVFPIWKKKSADLAHSFIDLGFKAVITCIDSQFLDKKFAGREYDEQFLRELPAGVDPCGENGEFHSFVYDGPIFKEKIMFSKGAIVLRDNRFYFCDLIHMGRNESNSPIFTKIRGWRRKLWG